MWAVPQVRWALVAAGLFLVALIAQVAGAPPWLYWTLYLGCYVTGGWEPGCSGLKALRDKTLDVDLLMIVAAIGAAAIGQVFDGGLLIVIFATSGALEAVATKRTEDSVRGLLDLAPESATRLNGVGGEETVDTSALVVGDEILVRPGERIGGDGVVVEGAGEVDQATITGEPLPVDKQVGDEVFAGTINGTGALRVRVTRPPADTVIARIVAMVAEASASKARLQLFIERIEQRYSVAMVIVTVGLFVIPLLLGAELQPTLLRAMSFMIVASPCAVVLATMPPLLAAIANAGRHGVLVKSAVVLERLGAITHVAFDKTGTLTKGAPWLAEVRLVASVFTRDEVLALAAAAEHHSEHPLARAVVDAAHGEVSIPTAVGFQSTPGRGVRARVGAHVVDVGSPVVLGEGDDDAARHTVAELEESGHTAVVVCVNERAVAVFGLTDHVRPGAAEAVAQVRAVTGTRPSLLSGDNPCAAGRLAAEVGIVDVHGGLLPEDKVAAVRDLELGGATVMLVGDGVNDAPAMAAAHVGVAMGRAGSDLALDTADVVITRDDLSTIAAVIALARRARRVVVANLVIAATFIAVLVAWDVFGHLPLPLGVAGHEGSTILVGLNGLRLLRDSAWRKAGLG